MTSGNSSRKPEHDAGREFMERTKYAHIGKSDQQKGLPQPLLELPRDPLLPLIRLPRPENLHVPGDRSPYRD